MTEDEINRWDWWTCLAAGPQRHGPAALGRVEALQLPAEPVELRRAGEPMFILTCFIFFPNFWLLVGKL